MCLCFRWQKYTIFLLLLIVEDYFHCLYSVVPPNQFSILTECEFRGGKVHDPVARGSCAARGPYARITPPHCGLVQGYRYGILIRYIPNGSK